VKSKLRNVLTALAVAIVAACPAHAQTTNLFVNCFTNTTIVGNSSTTVTWCVTNSWITPGSLPNSGPLLTTNASLIVTSLYTIAGQSFTNCWTNNTPSTGILTNTPGEVPFFPLGPGYSFGAPNGHVSFFGTYPPVTEPTAPSAALITNVAGAAETNAALPGILSNLVIWAQGIQSNLNALGLQH